jgi:transposase
MVHKLGAGQAYPFQERPNSPYDPEAKYCVKGTTRWFGYKVHLTETCLSEEIHLITNVETTDATTQDIEITEKIHQSLARKKENQLGFGRHRLKFL